VPLPNLGPVPLRPSRTGWPRRHDSPATPGPLGCNPAHIRQLIIRFGYPQMKFAPTHRTPGAPRPAHLAGPPWLARSSRDRSTDVAQIATLQKEVRQVNMTLARVPRTGSCQSSGSKSHLAHGIESRGDYEIARGMAPAASKSARAQSAISTDCRSKMGTRVSSRMLSNAHGFTSAQLRLAQAFGDVSGCYKPLRCSIRARH